jgi:hypothetical protein
MRFLKCTRMLLSMQGVDIPLCALVTGFNLTSGTGKKVYACPKIGKDECCTFKQAYDKRIFSQLTYGAVSGRVFQRGVPPTGTCQSHERSRYLCSECRRGLSSRRQENRGFCRTRFVYFVQELSDLFM